MTSLPDLVIQYQALRDREEPFLAAQARKRMVALAHALKAGPSLVPKSEMEQG